MQKFYLNREIIFGDDAITWIESIVSSRVFIVTDEMMIKLKVVNEVTDRLDEKGIGYQVFSDVVPDPSYEIVALGVKAMADYQPDVVVAIGGGSAIDTAKGILYAQWQISQKKGWLFKKPQFVAIPTTSGTGSEVTSFAVITIGSGKLALVDDFMIPDAALVDPRFVMTVPAAVTADTGLDVLCHALEAYVSTNASDFTDALSEKTIKLVFDYLLEAYVDGSNSMAREKMHNASCMAGIAFSNASLGLIHSMAHALGGAFHIPHGRSNAILMPFAMAANACNSSIATEKYAEAAHVLGLQADSPGEGCKIMIQAINALKKMMNVPMNIKEAGIKKEVFEAKLDEMANHAINDACMTTNPYKPELAEIKEIYRQAFGE